MKRFLAALLLGCSFPVHAVDGVSVEYGAGTRDVNLWRLGLQWKMGAFEHHQRWSGYWDLSVGGWHGNEGTVHDVGLTPAFRYSKRPAGPYLEAAIGFHILSDSHINSDLGFSTRFQFGDHLAAGYQAGKWDGQVRLQHLSNGGMKNPNPGINFLILRVQRWLD